MLTDEDISRIYLAWDAEAGASHADLMRTVEAEVRKQDETLVQTGWLVDTSDGPMFWPVEESDVASLYCQLNTSPVPMYSQRTVLELHIKAQEDEP